MSRWRRRRRPGPRRWPPLRRWFPDRSAATGTGGARSGRKPIRVAGISRSRGWMILDCWTSSGKNQKRFGHLEGLHLRTLGPKIQCYAIWDFTQLPTQTSPLSTLSAYRWLLPTLEPLERLFILLGSKIVPSSTYLGSKKQANKRRKSWDWNPGHHTAQAIIMTTRRLLPCLFLSQ